MVAKLERVSLKDVWKHEALDFTRWLEDNVDVLSDTLGLSLQNIVREKFAGDFRVDLVAEDDRKNLVVIENQLERSDHDRLGKLLTYLAALEAKTAVWIVSDPRPEHVKAIAWLNDSSSSASFYLVKAEAVRIGSSEPAALLTLIVGPGEAGGSISVIKEELAERHVTMKRFWSGLISRLREKQIRLHSNLSPGTENWLATGAGRAGLSWDYVILRDSARVELYIDLGKGFEAQTREVFEHLLERKAEIEKSFGEALEWHPLEGRRACRVSKVIQAGGLKDEERWNEIQEAMINAMTRLEKAFRPFIKDLGT